MSTHVQLHHPSLWPATKWRQLALRLGRQLGLIAEEAPILPPTRRQQLLAAQDQRRAEQRRAMEVARSRH
ncbi:hypothetical protein [Frateuria terrea]|uniref:Uncharacterized protein n=1 Tax=Frateuria terrea TaxID=529704 RepID=A0A1H6VJI5_9GAMM|nr:hypothetical protein [Frateuria terrea]SEJ01827.1 hypothetical protein SAMN04487997_2215 [Frateuria terrea]SFP64811.1 hypothetical protein SAMN02927913_3015 [Frateuria terrea]